MKLLPQITLMIAAIVLCSATITAALNTLTFIRITDKEIRTELEDVAETTALMPAIIEGLRGPPVLGEIQNQMQNVIDSFNDVDFVIVCNMDRQRYSHPDPSLIGMRFSSGDEARVLAGEGGYFTTASGPLGVSMRAFHPVFDGKEQSGFVVAGTMYDRVRNVRRQIVCSSLVYLLSGLVIGVVGALLLARRIKGILFGLEPEELAGVYHYHLGMLEAVHEGVIAVDATGRIAMINESARRLLGHSGEELAGKRIADVMPDSRLPAAMETGQAEYDQEQIIKGTTVITNIVPIIENGATTGAVETFRDKTMLIRLAEELTGARHVVSALRASSHEFVNKLQVLLGLLELGQYDRARRYILETQRFQSEQNRKLLDMFRDPIVAGLMLGKISYAREQNVSLNIREDSQIGELEDAEIIHALVTVIGNLIDNAVESARLTPRNQGRVTVGIHEREGEIVVTVEDNGPEIERVYMPRIFEQGFSTKGPDRGNGLTITLRDLETIGGSLKAASERGKTLFTARIPFARQSTETV